MKYLLYRTDDNSIVSYGISIEIGVYPEIMENELFKITMANGGITYVLAGDPALTIVNIEDDSIPEDFEEQYMMNKYLYSPEQGIYLSPYYQPPGPTQEEINEQNAAALSYLAIMTGVDLSDV